MANDRSELIRQLRLGRGDDLGQLLNSAREYVLEKDLIVLPATIDTAEVVSLNTDELTVHEVVDAAAKCGAKVMYLRAPVIDTGPVVAELPGKTSEDDALRSAVKRLSGHVAELELGFAHGGVVHVWAVTAPWFEAWETLSTADPDIAMRDRDYLDRDGEGMTDEQVQHWSAKLAGDHAFRRAVRPADREAAADGLPGLAAALQSGVPWQRSGIMNYAVQKVRDQAEERASSIKSQLDEFAAELSNEPEFCAITAATTRKRYVAEWMSDRADGFRLPSWFIDDLVGRARQAVKAAARPKARAGSAVDAELPLG